MNTSCLYFDSFDEVITFGANWVIEILILHEFYPTADTGTVNYIIL